MSSPKLPLNKLLLPSLRHQSKPRHQANSAYRGFFRPACLTMNRRRGGSLRSTQKAFRSASATFPRIAVATALLVWATVSAGSTLTFNTLIARGIGGVTVGLGQIAGPGRRGPSILTAAKPA